MTGNPALFNQLSYQVINWELVIKLVRNTPGKDGVRRRKLCSCWYFSYVFVIISPTVTVSTYLFVIAHFDNCNYCSLLAHSSLKTTITDKSSWEGCTT